MTTAQQQQRLSLEMCSAPRTELAPRFQDKGYAMAYARLVTHYVRHNGWLGDGRVIRELGRLAGIPAVVVCGRFDFQTPIGTAWELHQRWGSARLVIVDNAGHTPTESTTDALVRATDEFAPADSCFWQEPSFLPGP